ncbi:DUF4254 domain-containing protein [Streptomyces sp. SL13]|uniref:DUF4254 domain-containing protein n=1 Tax=Streptantibioticus silvisoli TaxID=2705255 RepID=A0AA90KIL3_9ACTN|nr:DUF4254 domain-containing protein [Streptantibioticus silvisoli]MDI5961389.1 DUF4254 domain-containing protein [Streptantibioticus silvisoli]MDI5973335.1 DUF4254 domain-containing protein [Streptantibioticus silvisoli]
MFIGTSRRLCAHHGRQWDAEDEARELAAEPEKLAAVKREIDAMNMRRSGLIDLLDTWVHDHITQEHAAPLHTETLGSIVDRLCIAWIRSQKLSAKARGDDDPVLAGKGALAARQLTELGHAYDVLVAEVTSGRRRVPDWRALKSYG